MRPGAREVRTLLVGGGVAAVRCARALRRAGDQGEILIVGAEGAEPYNRPPLSKELLRDNVPDELLAAEPPSWYARRRIELWTDARVERLDPDSRTVELADGRRVAFDRCLLATGASPRTLSVEGGERALLLRTIEDSRRLRHAVDEADPGSAVATVGGGFIGIEVASSIATRGHRPVILERADRLWGGQLGTLLSGWARRRLEEAGVSVMTDTTVERVEDGAVRTSDGRVEAAVLVAAVGVEPRVELARAAGLRVDDGVATDAGHRTSATAVWAAGDVARVDGRRIEHWHAAREGGERAARSMLGLDLGPPPAPWVFSEVAGSSLDVVGLTGASLDETWVLPDRLVTFTEHGIVLGLASIDGAADPAAMRRVVAQRTDLETVEESLAGG